jgi:hypothetical protein
MLYWIYDIHPLAAVGIFAALFVTVGLAAIMLSRSFVQSRVHQQPELNELVGDFLQYFGVIYGLSLAFLRWPRIKIIRTWKRRSATRLLPLRLFIGM